MGWLVEFPTNGDEVVAAPEMLEAVKQSAIACSLSQEQLLSELGLDYVPVKDVQRHNRPFAGFSNVLLATGHYRNGVLLAPATAQAIRQMIAQS